MGQKKNVRFAKEVILNFKLLGFAIGIGVLVFCVLLLIYKPFKFDEGKKVDGSSYYPYEILNHEDCEFCGCMTYMSTNMYNDIGFLIKYRKKCIIEKSQSVSLMVTICCVAFLIFGRYVFLMGKWVILTAKDDTGQ